MYKKNMYVHLVVGIWRRGSKDIEKKNYVQKNMYVHLVVGIYIWRRGSKDIARCLRQGVHT